MANVSKPVVNDLLCYVSSARDALTQDHIILNSFAHYGAELIKKAKEIICKAAGERNIVRKPCNTHPDPSMADLKDIYACFEKIEADSIACPKFLAEGYAAFPPKGFEYISPVVCSLRDEISALRIEVAELRKNNERDVRALNNTNTVAQDVIEIKTLVQRAVAELDAARDTSNGGQHNGPPRNVNTEQSSNVDLIPQGHERDSMGVSGETPAASDDFSSGGGGSGWQVVNDRPYANALRRNGLPANSVRRQSNFQGGRQGRHNEHGHSRRGEPGRPNLEGGLEPMHGGSGRGFSRKRTVIFGTKAGDSSGISGGDRICEIFVGGCKSDSSPDGLEEYCSQNGITVKKCEPLNQTSEWVRSFKVSIAVTDREKLLNADFWPCGVFVRQFFRARPRNES